MQILELLIFEIVKNFQKVIGHMVFFTVNNKIAIYFYFYFFISDLELRL
jgi:hypothetical protein